MKSHACKIRSLRLTWLILRSALAELVSILNANRIRVVLAQVSNYLIISREAVRWRA